MAIRLPVRRGAKAAPTVIGTATPATACAQPSPRPRELLTIREAMAIAKAGDSTIRRWIRTKELRAYKIGGQVRIDKSDLLNFIHPWLQRNVVKTPDNYTHGIEYKRFYKKPAFGDDE